MKSHGDPLELIMGHLPFEFEYPNEDMTLEEAVNHLRSNPDINASRAALLLLEGKSEEEVIRRGDFGERIGKNELAERLSRAAIFLVRRKDNERQLFVIDTSSYQSSDIFIGKNNAPVHRPAFLDT